MSASDRHPLINAASVESADSTVRPAHIEALFREHNQSLVRFLAARLSSDAEAKEVAQEAYVRLLQLDRPQAVGFLRAFLFKTASNIATDHLRRRRRAKVMHARDTFTFETEQRSPEDYVSSAEEVEIVSACLNDLSPRCRQVVLLSRIEGKDANEVATELGMSTRMVRKYISEALALMHDRLETSQIRRQATAQSSKEGRHE